MLVAMLLAVSLVGARCEVEGAHYRLRGRPDVIAQFRDTDTGADWPAGVTFQIVLRKSGHSYWFIPWEGGTDDLRQMASAENVLSMGWRPPDPDGSKGRPYGDLDYVGTDAHYNVIAHVPRRGETAPAHILLLNLGDVLHHQARDEFLPQQFFDLVSCNTADRLGH